MYMRTWEVQLVILLCVLNFYSAIQDICLCLNVQFSFFDIVTPKWQIASHTMTPYNAFYDDLFCIHFSPDVVFSEGL